MYIISNDMLSKDSNNEYFLRLNREQSILEVYKKCESSKLRDEYPIRKEFDESGYTMFELYKEMKCIFGGEGKKRTPSGLFHIYDKSNGEYRSSYYEDRDCVKFFGYLAIFEDYFIHSDLYDENVTEENFRNTEPISKEDEHTSGCIRVCQKNLDWLVEHIEVGTIVEVSKSMDEKERLKYKEIWATVVNYTFGEETDFAKRMINAVNSEIVNKEEVNKDVFKELIIEMRGKLKDLSLADDTKTFKERFPLASMNTNRKYGSYKTDGILYNNDGTIAHLYGEDGIKQCPTSKLTHTYYNELDHYFTHVLNFYPLVKKIDRDKLLALQIKSGKGTAVEPGIYAVICDSLIGSKKCKLKIDEYKAVIIRILESEDLVKCGR